jgi:hypothetical protein
VTVWNRVRNALLTGLSGQVQEELRSFIPPHLQPAPAPMPAPYGDDYAGMLEPPTGDDGLVQNPGPGGMGQAIEVVADSEYSFAFETPKERALNLSRAIGVAEQQGRDSVYVYPPLDIVFVGDLDALGHYCEDHDLDDGWEEWDAEELEKHSGDKAFARRLLAQAANTGVQRSGKQYSGFHWGEPMEVVSVRDIPGVGGEALAFLGVCRELFYAQGEKDFEVVSGHNKAPSPFVYALGDRVIVISGVEYDHSLVQALNAAAKNAKGIDLPGEEGHGRSFPGITGQLRPLGPCWEITYGSKKGGKFVEFFHELGEDSGVYPTLYLLGEATLIVAGANTTIENEGITD